LTKLYLDSSTIVKRYVQEKGSDSASVVYTKSDAQELVICFSIWNIGEVVGVIDHYQRRDWITAEQSRVALSNLSSETLRLMKIESLELLSLSSSELSETWDLVRNYHIYQADALQIVAAKRSGADMLLSADKLLLDVGKNEGLPVANIEDAHGVEALISRN